MGYFPVKALEIKSPNSYYGVACSTFFYLTVVKTKSCRHEYSNTIEQENIIFYEVNKLLWRCRGAVFVAYTCARRYDETALSEADLLRWYLQAIEVCASVHCVRTDREKTIVADG